MAYLALFVALGGGAYAALTLPRNSVGSKQIKADAVRSSKVKNGSLLRTDFKAGQLPTGERGPQGLQGLPGTDGLRGDKGDACLASNPDCRGSKGDIGPPGPGTLTFEGQFANGGENTIATMNGMVLKIRCEPGASSITVYVERVDSNHNFFGWGLGAADGGSVSVLTVATGGTGDAVSIQAVGVSKVQAEFVVRSAALGETGKFTDIDILGLRGNACNYHALVIPPA